MKQKHIAIIGAGTAGSASALFLKQSGHRVTLFEKVAQPSAIGAGLLLQPSGLYALDALNLGSEIRTLGSKITDLDGRTRTGRPVIKLHYPDLKPDYHGVGIHRAALFSSLHNALGHAGICFETGVEISQYQQSKHGVTLLNNQQKHIGQFDGLIVANGARSNLRAQHPYVSYDCEYPWGALWAIVDKPNDLPNHCLHQTYHTAQYMLGLLPTGSINPNTNPLVSLFWSLPTQQFKQWNNGEIDFEQWKKDAIALSPLAKPVMEQLTSHKQLALATYRDVVMKQWHDQGVVFIGDAAHSMSPQLGQGANLALCDAFVLNECVNAHDDWQTALRQYNHDRRGHTRFYQTMSRLLTPFYQSNNRPYAWVRDALSSPFTQIPWVRRQMLLTLTGLKTGLISDAEPQTLLRKTEKTPFK